MLWQLTSAGWCKLQFGTRPFGYLLLTAMEVTNLLLAVILHEESHYRSCSQTEQSLLQMSWEKNL
jgi:hypothetical protein